MQVCFTVTTSGLVELGLWNLVWRLIVSTKVEYIFDTNTIPIHLIFQVFFNSKKYLSDCGAVVWATR